MIVSPRCIRLLHLALVFAAVAGVLRAGASWGDRMPPAVRLASADRNRTLGTGLALAMAQSAPQDRASTRLESPMRAAWQRGGRRSPRLAPSQFAGAERTLGTSFGSTAARRTGAAWSARLARVRGEGRLRATPTRAPPKDC